MTKKILVADDEVTIAELLEQSLIEEGYDVQKSIQSLRFYDAVREYHPDLILLDLMMPYLEGEDELRLMQLSPETANIPSPHELGVDSPTQPGGAADSQ